MNIHINHSHIMNLNNEKKKIIQTNSLRLIILIMKEVNTFGDDNTLSTNFNVKGGERA